MSDLVWTPDPPRKVGLPYNDARDLFFIDAPPDQCELPCSIGSIAEDYQEHPQSVLLTDAILPRLWAIHPDGEFVIGQNCGIYFGHNPPVVRGVAPDWFYIPGASMMIRGRPRRTYTRWSDIAAPLVVIEFITGDGREERDQTRLTGNQWIIESALSTAYYVLFTASSASLEVHECLTRGLVAQAPNVRGRYLISPLGVELGVWNGQFMGIESSWLRWYDPSGRLLPTGHERAERLAARLRELGVDPEAL